MIVVHETTNPYTYFFRLLSYMYGYKFVTLKNNILDDREWVDVTEGITPSDVLPHDWSYFTYQGSLTTPPCFETVTWINMRCPIKVSKRVRLMFTCIVHLHLKVHVSKKYLKFILSRLDITGILICNTYT